MDVFTTFDCNLPRARLGDKADGGYVLSEGLPPYDYLLSGGVDKTVLFENAFVNRYDVPCVVYDHTVESLPAGENDPRVTHERRMVGAVESDSGTNLTPYLDRYDDVFVKMDVEASEWEWIEALRSDQLDRISQMVIELHLLMDTEDTKKLHTDMRTFRRRLEVVKKLTQTHMLTHVHANNYGGSFAFKGREYPCVMECTFLRKRTLGRIQLASPNTMLMLNMRTFPSELDAANANNRDDLNADLLNDTPFRFNRFVQVKVV
jgi:hypothetical protein